MPRTFGSEGRYRRYQAFIHIRGIPHHKHKVSRRNGKVYVGAPIGGWVNECPHCNSQYRKLLVRTANEVNNSRRQLERT